MKYFKCEKCETNYVKEKGDLCEFCKNSIIYEENEEVGYCVYCGIKTKDNEEICENCKIEREDDDEPKLLKEEDIFKLFF